jgi:ATP-dependent exoDNAse (exonuclease V) alpha subunit
VHRCQSQSIDFVAVDMSKDVFGHGQLYTALSRLRESDRLLLMVDEASQDNVEDKTTVHVHNIIYPPLILHP